jgi:hypothetical protein
MTILKITSDIPRHSENFTSFPDPSFDVHFITGGFNTEVVDSFKLLKTPYTPNKGDKIYFLPGVNVPRVKFKNVCVEHGIKTIRDVEQANIIFASKKSISDITTDHWCYKCKTEDFKAFIKLYEAEMDGHNLDKLETALEYYDQEFIAIDYNLTDWIINTVDDADPSFRYSDRLSMIKDEYVDLFNALQTKEILDEASVINVLNGEDATEIDKVMFEHLSDMFDSSDNDNHVLAMEIMANSKYVESLIYLELLFYKFNHAISNTNSKNHVNFKSLISYLGKDKNYLGTDIDDIVNSLRDKDQLTPDKLDILLSYTSKDIQQRGDTKYFTVKTVSVTPEILAQLNTNYTYGLQEDFVPTVAEIPVEEVLELEGPTGPTGPEDNLQEVKSEFAAEDNFDISAEEAEEDTTDVLEPEPVSEISESQSNNNQIETNDTNDFEWF